MKLDHYVLASSALGNARKIRVFVPDGKGPFSVLYVHDGEYCFRMDAPPECECLSLDRVIEAGHLPLIVVSLAASIWQIRTQEYSPFPWVGEAEKYLHPGEEKGGDYLGWIIREVKPFVDANYPTLADRKHTFMLGCSLGAQLSVYASARYPTYFSKIGCFSLADWGNEEALLSYLKAQGIPSSTSFFVRVGGKEGIPRDLTSLGECYPAKSENFVHLLASLSLPYDYKINPENHHKTADWEKDMPEFLTWLFQEGTNKGR